MGVGPAPWKLLRDRAAKDPEWLKSPSVGGGRRAQGEKGFRLTPKRQQKSSRRGCEMQPDPESGGDTEVSLPPRSGTTRVGASLVRALVAEVPRAGPVSVSENADVGSSFI